MASSGTSGLPSAVGTGENTGIEDIPAPGMAEVYRLESERLSSK